MMIAGEASGDVHGAKVIKEIQRIDPVYRIIGIGGSRMQVAGQEPLYNIEDLAVMGFWEVLKNLRRIKKILWELIILTHQEKPDLIILIDYPGFNLAYAKRIQSLKIPILYYISPQVWAWHASRVRKIAELVQKMAVIFPFEISLYEKCGLETIFVGHPILEDIEEYKKDNAPGQAKRETDSPPVLGLVPGSRIQEINRILPVMLNAAELLKQKIPQLRIKISCAPTIERNRIERWLEKNELKDTMITDEHYSLLSESTFLLVTSGTATLEAALFRTPFLVIYKTSFLTWFLGRLLIRIKQIGLVNIVAGKPIVPELIQANASAQKIFETAYPYFCNMTSRQRMIEGLAGIQSKLGLSGASRRVAAIAVAMIDQS